MDMYLSPIPVPVPVSNTTTARNCVSTRLRFSHPPYYKHLFSSSGTTPSSWRRTKRMSSSSCRATSESEGTGSQDHDEKEIQQQQKQPDKISTISKLDDFFAKNAKNQNPDEEQPDKISTISKLDDFIAKNAKNQNPDEEVIAKLDSNGGDPLTQTDGQDKEDDGNDVNALPLPDIKTFRETFQIPKATIDVIKEQVFGFDTFFITGQEPYEGGVLFKGNVRGTAAKSYAKLDKRLKDKFGDEFRLFLLINPEDEKPVAVVVPKITLEPSSTAVPEWFAAVAFGGVTIGTLLVRNVPALQSNLLSTFDNPNLLLEGLPGALVTLLILGVHEAAHFLVAKDIGIKLGIPYLVPSWQVGSFGTITRILNIVPNRQDLLKLAAAGPVAGYALGLVLLLLGFILPPSDGVGVIIDPVIFHESFLPAAIAKLALGDALKEGTKVAINPLVLWAWAGLLINAINSIPAGELDGGRIAFSLWGRKISSRISSVTIAVLGISSLFSDVAFYWVVLIFFLQRGPIAPLSEEITDVDSKYAALGVAALLIGLLICLPYPFPFASETIMGIDL